MILHVILDILWAHHGIIWHIEARGELQSLLGGPDHVPKTIGGSLDDADAGGWCTGGRSSWKKTEDFHVGTEKNWSSLRLSLYFIRLTLQDIVWLKWRLRVFKQAMPSLCFCWTDGIFRDKRHTILESGFSCLATPDDFHSSWVFRCLLFSLQLQLFFPASNLAELWPHTHSDATGRMFFCPPPPYVYTYAVCTYIITYTHT